MKELHWPIERIVPGADMAVLFVHGLLGTPRFFLPFLEQVPQDVSYLAMTLPGHGGTVPEFGRVAWGAWRTSVREALDRLSADHDRVYIVAHSLGTLLAINVLSEHPGKTAGAVMIAVPLHLRVRMRALAANLLKGIGLGEDPETLSAYYGTDQDARVWRYASWLPRYAELFAESAQARKNLPRLDIPMEVFMFKRDELVSLRSCDAMADAKSVRLHRLPESGHHAFAPAERAQMADTMRRMIRP